jgi:histidinol dehydrogenase
MKTFIEPELKSWPLICRRPVIKRADLTRKVQSIIQQVKESGDAAIRYYAKKFDNIQLQDIRVNGKETKEGIEKTPQDLKDAIRQAFQNIQKFHALQQACEVEVETMPGVLCKRLVRPIERVGLYIPGGSAPLFSTVLMLGIPAKLAGCREIVLCTPPSPDGKIHPAILFTANLCGIKEIYKTGGAQAIAAMAYGTASIRAVSKIFGPGNQYVTQAKQIVSMDGIAIDMPAGPSEVLVLADQTAHAGFIAADLLSQAEHGTDSQVVLVTNDKDLPARVNRELKAQLKKLNRRSIASVALQKSLAVVFNSTKNCVDFINTYAPEHLIINTRDPKGLLNKIESAGSVFLGPFSPESVGDYASGTNHTLPTNGYAKAISGISVDSFRKYITVQEISAAGLKKIGAIVEKMAEAETLDAHKHAVTIRLDYLK